MYHSLETIDELHLEITNKCNAACPMCDRNYCGGATRPELKLSEWSLKDIDRVISPELVNLRNVLFCGTHGDPMVAKYALEAVTRIKSTTKATVEFYSNASGRTEAWWAEMGKLLSEKKNGADKHYRQNDLGVFSIDGLSDTNGLYRRNTNYDKILTNARAFISAGGIARWDFIVFKHNEHQVEEARSLAKKMGFKQFRVRKTARFNYSPLGPDKWPVYDREGLQEYVIEPPVGDQYRNDEVNKFEQLVDHYGSAQAYFDVAKIDCLYRNKFHRIYVNSEVQVFPCCYLGNDIVPKSKQVFKSGQPQKVPPIREDSISKVFSIYKLGFNDLRKKSWSDILEHSWLREALEKSWNQSLAEGRLMRCARTCGDAYSPILSQSHDQGLQEKSQEANS